MQVHHRESERLRLAGELVRERFPRFGVNKSREITRLLYEISKRDGIAPGGIIPKEAAGAFKPLKAYLLARRFPITTEESSAFHPYLPGFELDDESCLQIRKTPFYPWRIYIEESAQNSSLAARFRSVFPRAECLEILSLKEFMGGHTGGGIPEYNRRSGTAFIINEERDFFKRCPCTRQAVPCGYHICNLSFGCIFECTYCYLQEYVNTPGIIFPANLDFFFDRFMRYRDNPSTRAWQRGETLRLGTGEFSDSLMLDDLTGYSLPLVEFFRGRDDVIFEFKTKSANISNLLKIDPGGNIVIAWSLNPEKIITANEFYTASLAERLDAARLVSEAGYRLAFHFDPVFYFSGWEGEYREVIDRLFGLIDPEKIAWISLGTLRFKPALKKIIEARFPGNSILNSEMVLGYDDKLRYPAPVRYRVYRSLIDAMTGHNRSLPIYLCMEERSMWEELKLTFPF